jgi:hypothetical protein
MPDALIASPTSLSDRIASLIFSSLKALEGEADLPF